VLANNSRGKPVRYFSRCKHGACFVVPSVVGSPDLKKQNSWQFQWRFSRQQTSNMQHFKYDLPTTNPPQNSSSITEEKYHRILFFLLLMLLFPRWHDNYATLFLYSLPLLASYDWSTAIAVMYLNGYGAISKKFTPGWRSFKCLQIR